MGQNISQNNPFRFHKTLSPHLGKVVPSYEGPGLHISRTVKFPGRRCPIPLDRDKIKWKFFFVVDKHCLSGGGLLIFFDSCVERGWPQNCRKSSCKVTIQINPKKKKTSKAGETRRDTLFCLTVWPTGSRSQDFPPGRDCKDSIIALIDQNNDSVCLNSVVVGNSTQMLDNNDLEEV